MMKRFRQVLCGAARAGPGRGHGDAGGHGQGPARVVIYVRSYAGREMSAHMHTYIQREGGREWGDLTIVVKHVGWLSIKGEPAGGRLALASRHSTHGQSCA